MTPRSLATVLVRVIGVYLLAMTLVGLPSTLALRGYDGSGAQPGAESAIRVQLQATLLSVAVGPALLLASGPIVRIITRGTDSQGDASPQQDIYPLALSVVGVWLAVNALSPLGAWLALFIQLSHSLGGTARDDYFQAHWTTIVSLSLQLAVGLCLFVGAKGLAATWRRLRPTHGAVSG